MAEQIDYSAFPSEPEEIIEASLCGVLSDFVNIPIYGAITNERNADTRKLTGDTFVSVSVDQSSQDLDFKGANVPCSYTARIVVHVALADCMTGITFDGECKCVRAALLSLTGDACESIGAESFACDAFVIGATSTNFDAGDNPAYVKAYTAALKGRITNTQTEA